MTTYFSMLRGINVAGQKRIGMPALTEVYESLGFDEVRTYIQSGNVIFGQESSKNDPRALASKIEERIKKDLSFDVQVFVRSAAELGRIVKSAPPFVRRDPTKAHVTFLYMEPAPGYSIEEMSRAKGRGEEFSVSGREVYLLCPNGYGTSKLTNTFFERKLKVPATTRNWNTVKALCNMVAE